MITKENSDSGEMDVKNSQIEKAVDALLQYLKKSKSKNAFLDEHQPINLQLDFKKVPKNKNKIVKIVLPHSLVTECTDVCLLVKDLDKKNRDFEPTERHFKELLDEKGVTYVNEVIPLKSLKMEYQPYEAKKNLATMYDVFLADERIIRLLPPFLGKNFYGKKKNPIQVNLKATDLKGEITKALGTAQCIISGRGSTCQVTVGRSTQTQSQIVRNIVVTVNKLGDAIPGGPANIRSIHIKSVDSPSLPVYISLDSANDVNLPPRKRKREFIEPEDVTPIIHGKVRVTPRGAVSIVNAATAKTTEDKNFVAEGKKAKKKAKAKKRGEVKKAKENFTEEEQPVVKTKRRKVSDASDLENMEKPIKKSSKRKASSREDEKDTRVDDVKEESVSPKKKKSKVSTPRGKKTPQKDSEGSKSMTMKETDVQQKCKTPKAKTPKSKTNKGISIETETLESKDSTKSAKKVKSLSKIDTPNSGTTSKSAKKMPNVKKIMLKA